MSMNNTFELPDGRIMGYAEYGLSTGKPLIYCHGSPGSRLETYTDDESLKALGIRLIVPDRPGFGLSTYQPGRQIKDWPADCSLLLDHLGIVRFSVLGFSAGGAYALACAALLPERVRQVALVSSLAPHDNPMGIDGLRPENLGLQQFALSDPKACEQQLSELIADGDQLFSLMIDPLPESDQLLFKDASLSTLYRQDMAESLVQGYAGVTQDCGLLASSWGFDLASVGTPVYLWQGLNDCYAPEVMGRYLSQVLPQCEGRFLADEGHYLLFRHWTEILQKLAV